MITLDGVGVRYGSASALAEVTAQVPAGQWLGIIGPNGAGKTTLLRSIACLVPHDGQIAIGGQPTSRLRRRELARLVAYVPQLPELPPEMTVADYVLLGRPPHIGYLRMETDADRRSCSNGWRCRRCQAGGWPRCPAVSGKGSFWPVPWPSRRRCCCSTSRPAPWTSAAGWTPGNSSMSCAASGPSPSCPRCTTSPWPASSLTG